MRSLLTLIASAVLALVVASAAMGRPLPEPVSLAASHSSDDEPARSAQLALAGSGKVQLNGRLVVYGELARASTVIVRGGRDSRLMIDGRQLRLRRGVARARRASGRLYIHGRRLRVTIVSRDMSMSMAGLGTARLRGLGRFSLNGSEELEWGPRWLRVRPGATPPRAVTPNRRREHPPAAPPERNDR